MKTNPKDSIHPDISVHSSETGYIGLYWVNEKRIFRSTRDARNASV